MNVVNRRATALASISLVAFVIAGCGGSASATPTSQISPLANSDWTLTTFTGRTLPAGANVTLLFGVLQAGGFSGCNQFQTSYATLDTGIRFGPIAGTRISCGATVDAFETGYYSALSSVTHWGITNDVLELSTATGEKIVTYARMAPATVEGPWNITGVNNGSQAVGSTPTGVTANMTFAPDGTVSGFGGCNSFGGGYTVGATDQISIGPLMSSLQACGDPADTFEHQLLTALQGATKWSVTGGNLELRDDGGALQVSASSAAAQ
jgi:heat shock protein HslJ